MKTKFMRAFFLRGAGCAAAALAAGVLFCAPVLAADSPTDAAAAPAPAAPPPPPAGTWFVFSPPKADVVLPSAMREKMLSVAKSTIDRSNPALLAKLQAADNPFYLKLVAPVETPSDSQSGNNSATPTPPPVPKLTDDDRLKLVAAQLKPSGILEGGGRRLVQTGSGSIEVGKSFTVTFPNDAAPSEIQLIDATDSSCTLKLHDATLDVDYVSNASATPASRPAPAPTPAPAPAAATPSSTNKP